MDFKFSVRKVVTARKRMAEQGSLFESTNHDGHVEYSTSAQRQTRVSHGETSLEAIGKSIESGSFTQRCRFAYEMVCKYPGRTGAELDRLAGCKKREVSKRLADVERHDKIESPSDRRRVCSVNGNRCKTWWPVRGTSG